MNKCFSYFCIIFILVVVTSAPGNDAELQLYRVMQRASLLAYYDTLLEMGKCTNTNTLILTQTYLFFIYLYTGPSVLQTYVRM